MRRVGPTRMDVVTAVGVVAAVCTTAANFPQKCWATGKAEDLSLKTYCILAVGLTLWVVYGIWREDAVLVVANIVSLLLVAGILYFKIRDVMRPAPGSTHGTSA